MATTVTTASSAMSGLNSALAIVDKHPRLVLVVAIIAVVLVIYLYFNNNTYMNKIKSKMGMNKDSTDSPKKSNTKNKKPDSDDEELDDLIKSVNDTQKNTAPA